MAKVTKQKVSKEEVLVDVAEVTHKAESWFETNKKVLLVGLIGVVAIIGGSIAWKSYIAGKQKEALQAVWKAEMLFEKDSFATALSSTDANSKGFQQIIEKYGSTPAGNVAQLYAGISYMQLGKFDEAINALDDFSPAGGVSPALKYGLLGDAYSEKKDYSKALKYYKDASSAGSIEELNAMYLKRYAMLSEMQNDLGSALSAYQELKEKYPTTQDGGGVDKYIARVMAKKK